MTFLHFSRTLFYDFSVVKSNRLLKFGKSSRSYNDREQGE